MMENAMRNMDIFAKRTKVDIFIFRLIYFSSSYDSTILLKMVSVVYISSINLI